MSDQNAIASNIRNARLFKNYSQDYVAFKLGISQNAYSKVECGYTKITIDRLTEIGQILEVDMNDLLATPNLRSDIEAVARLEIIPKLLEIICQTTGVGFVAVARVTEDKWIACRVLDQISFGLEKGDELGLESTICNEIRQTGEAVIIDNVAEDSVFCHHKTPAMYGFQSYISMPILRRDGSFFGTLCAIDPKPRKLNNPTVIGMFQLFAELISFHVNSINFYLNKPYDHVQRVILPDFESKMAG
jgi:transcriptional regulator with XRE-family HTH domain